MAISDSEWAQRTLCSDGNCIGIIGADGRCKTCGRPYDGERSQPAIDSNIADDDIADPPDDQHMTEDGESVGDDLSVDTEASDEEWAQRTLCIDGSCIGVVGPDGRCKVCGKPYRR